LSDEEGGIVLDFDREKAKKLAQLPTRLATLAEATRKELVNLGYIMAGAAILDALGGDGRRKTSAFRIREDMGCPAQCTAPKKFYIFCAGHYSAGASRRILAPHPLGERLRELPTSF